MKARDWSAVIVMLLGGLVCLYFAVDAVLTDEVICLSRSCARSISHVRQPKMYYFNLGGLLVLAGFLLGCSGYIVFRSGNRNTL